MSDREGGWWPGQDEDDDPDPDHPEAAESTSGQDPPAGEPPRPPRGLESRDRPTVASRYSMFVGLAFVAIVAVAVLNAIRTDEGGVAGSDAAADRGVPISEFAVPRIPDGPAGDANIDQDNCDSGRNPCPEDEIRTPACEIETPGAIRICDLFDKPLAISFWFTKGGDCVPTQDDFAAVAERRSRQVNFLSINILDDRERVDEIVAASNWGLPVGHDADGAVSNIFGIGGCPSILLAYPGGIIHAVEVGEMDESQIDASIDDLVAASQAREERG